MIYPVTRALLPAATLLIERSLYNTPYVEGAIDALRRAVDAPNGDDHALAFIVSDDSGGDFMVAVMVYGIFGGTSGAGRLHYVVVDLPARRAGVGAVLVRVAIDMLEEEGARLLLAELPDDDLGLPGGRPFLESLGFAEESRMENFLREGLAMTFMRRELVPRNMLGNTRDN